MENLIKDRKNKGNITIYLKEEEKTRLLDLYEEYKRRSHGFAVSRSKWISILLNGAMNNVETS